MKGLTMTINPNTLAMSENRTNWKIADVHHTTVLLPGPYREYLKGLISTLNGMVLMERVETHDEEVLEAFSDKQPRLPFSEIDVRLAMRNASAEQKSEFEDLIELLTLRAELQENAKNAIEENDEQKARYWYAKDYAVSYLIRGMFKMLQEELQGRGIPKEFGLRG